MDCNSCCCCCYWRLRLWVVVVAVLVECRRPSDDRNGRPHRLVPPPLSPSMRRVAQSYMGQRRKAGAMRILYNVVIVVVIDGQRLWLTNGRRRRTEAAAKKNTIARMTTSSRTLVPGLSRSRVSSSITSVVSRDE